MKNIDPIRIENLAFSYPSNPVFSAVGLTVPDGSFTLITGANGGGKSTLFKLILGELSPESGKIEVFGLPPHKLKNWSKVGYLPQNAAHSLTGFPANVEEVVRAGVYAQTGFLRFTAQKQKQSALGAMQAVGVEHLSKRMIGELSGGQVQRVMLARVLAGDPTLLLLDEPTTGVDRDSVRKFYELLQKLNREKNITILMVTHDLANAAAFATQVFCLEQGSIAKLEKPQIQKELASKHTHDCCKLD